jgi:hypothetical protein
LINYKNGEIIFTGPFYKKTVYDVSNNLIAAGFDGQGALSGYAVINKYLAFNSFYSLFSLNGKPLDWGAEKRVSMAGRRQIIELSLPQADLTITQFLDNGSNCIYNEIKVYAKEDLEFKNVINYGVHYTSYLKELVFSRFKPSVILRAISGFLLGKKPGCEKKPGCDYIHNDLTGDYYLDFAFSENGAPLEKVFKHYTQVKFGGRVEAGKEKCFRYTLSVGGRKDGSYADVRECLINFDAKKKEAQEYIDSLNAYPADNEFLKAYYHSLLNCALSNFKDLGRFKGFLAGIVYQFPARTYYRDAYWTSLAALPVRPDLVKEEIITLAQGIDKKSGKCPSAVKSNFKNYWGDHLDSPAFFVILLYDYIVHTGDKSILTHPCKCGTVFDAAVKALNRLGASADHTGLLVKEGEYNRRDWCDNVFRGGYVTYDEALWARALFAMSRLCKAKGCSERAKAYYENYEKVKAAINDILWSEEKGYFVNYKEKDFTEDNLSIDTCLVILFGLCDKERALSTLKNMEKLLESKNNPNQVAGDFGVFCVFPFYKDIEDVVQKSSLPYYYHNGGDWPYLSAAYAYAKLMHDMDYTYPLTRWFEKNIEKGNYTPVEFFSPVHPDGSLLQAWSSAGAFVLSYPKGDFFTKELE